MRRTLAILAAFALLATTLAVAQAPMSGPPKVLQIVREEVKVGKGPGHEKNEAAWLQAMIAAKYTTHVLTVTAVTGPTEEWFISGFDSFAAWEKDSKLFDAQPLKGVMDNYGAKDAEFISESRLITARYRPDLSYHPDVNIGEYKYFAVGILRLKIGHDPDDAFKAVIGAHTKANDDVHFATYMVNSGMAIGTYLIFSPIKSAAEWDQPSNSAYTAALKDANFSQIVERDTAAYDPRLFAFDPQLSNVSDAVAKADPSFWRPKPPAPKTGGAAKPAATAPKEGAEKKADTKK